MFKTNHWLRRYCILSRLEFYFELPCIVHCLPHNSGEGPIYYQILQLSELNRQNTNLDSLTNTKDQGCICQIFTGGSEFRLATSDYSGHGGCQIGTVE